MATIFKRNPIQGSKFKQVLESRRNLLKSSHGDQTIVIDNPAYIEITGTCKKCKNKRVSSMTLPKNKETWDSVYGSITPPLLENVRITYGGDHGMSQAIEATIRCFSRNTFEDVTDAFLLAGNEINVTFGKSAGTNKYNSSEQSVIELKKFTVATFSFSTEGQEWVGKFKAISMGEGIKALDMGSIPEINLKYMIGGEQSSELEVKATSLAEIVEADAQKNGERSKDVIGKSNVGYVVGHKALQGYRPSKAVGNNGDGVAMVLYTPDHLKNDGNASMNWQTRLLVSLFANNSSQNSAYNEVYVTLGYVVDRLINGSLKKSYVTSMQGNSDDKEVFEKLHFGFHNEYSYTKLVDSPIPLQSGDPTSVLILDDSRRGNFTGGALGIDFNDIKTSEGGNKRDVIALTDPILGFDLKKILINKRVLIEALNTASGEDVNSSTNVDPNDQVYEVISVTTFFRELFKIIKDCTGGAISLTLSYDQEETDSHMVYIVDQNYAGTSPLEVYYFDPINGDGSTLESTISSNGGSQEYKTAMYLNVAQKSTVVSKLRDCADEELDGIKNLNNVLDVQNQYKILCGGGITIPLIIKDAFKGITISKFKSLMTNTYQQSLREKKTWNNINFPAVELSLSIKGTWGIICGNAIATTHMPKSWLQDKGIYFTVTEVTHNFEGSKWTTDVRGILSYYSNLDIIDLSYYGEG